MQAALAELSPTAGQRLVSLDAFRGITIAGMILVNNPGSWKHVYGPLRHAEWHGWTPTDLVFPFFLFIVGVALAFSFGRRLAEGAGRLPLLVQVFRRTAVLFLLGLAMTGVPDWRLIGPFVLVMAGVLLVPWDRWLRRGAWSGAALARIALGLAVLVAGVACFGLDFRYFEDSHLRVPGVLQRIAACYCCASLIVIAGGRWAAAGGLVIVLAAYWWIVAGVQPPAGYEATVTDPEGLLHDWVDVRVLGAHLYRERPDPEGILSTLPAIGTVLAGVLAGYWLRSTRDARVKVVGLFVAANVALVLGLWISWSLPINKKIWTSSYVLATAGVALHFLAVCYWLIDMRGWRRWAWPFVVFGSNAIVVYVAASTGAKLLAITKLADGQTTLKGWLYEHLCASWAGPLNGSLAYPLMYLALWLIPMYVLYRLRVFVKI